MQRIMARLDRSSATKSAIHLTPKAVRSIRKAACAIGGPDADLKHFEEATAQLAAQYDTYRALFPDLSVNGKQTLAENIADVAGISAAYDGYHAALAGKSAPEQDGFNGDQQFFIAFAQNWGSKSREPALRQQVATDPHAPAQYRADTVRNIDAWYAAFDVKPGEILYLAPPNRVRIW